MQLTDRLFSKETIRRGSHFHSIGSLETRSFEINVGGFDVVEHILTLSPTDNVNRR